MRQSELFFKTLKQAPKDEKSGNAELLIRAGYIDKLMAGVYTYLPLGLRVLRKIEAIIREEMNRIKGQEILMPALHPLENYKKTKRDQIDVLFYTRLQNKTELVLGQSHEEVVTPLLQKFASSYKDLPKAVYQFQNKFRNELRAKSGIMRTREFIMKDMYSFHTSQEDLDAFYLQVQEAYQRIFEKCGLGHLTYLTYASGGTFSKYSHEYQALTEAGEDRIHICKSCGIAINKEILEDQNHQCPECQGKDLDEKRSVEVGNIFKLGNRFSSAFGYDYTDRDGTLKQVIMGCYGIGLGRLMGTIVEAHHDERGIQWPVSVAPFRVHLVRLGENTAVQEQSESLYKRLTEQGFQVLYDERVISMGEKLKDSDLMGIPYRVLVSEKTKEKIEFKNRKTGDTYLVNNQELIHRLGGGEE